MNNARVGGSSRPESKCLVIVLGARVLSIILNKSVKCDFAWASVRNSLREPTSTYTLRLFSLSYTYDALHTEDNAICLANKVSFQTSISVPNKFWKNKQILER